MINNNQNIEQTYSHFDEEPTKNYTSNTIVKMIRRKIIDAIIKFINKKIKYYLKNNINHGRFIKQFKQIDKSDLSHSKVEYDKKFIYLKLKDIFSKDISQKISLHPPEHNRNLVQSLINEETEGHMYFSEFFELTFLDCLEHIRGTKNIELLYGLNNMNDIFDSYKDNNILYDKLIDYVKSFEKFLERKKSRTKKNIFNY